MRALLFSLGAVALLIPTALYGWWLSYLGFPDGYVTDLERVQKILYGGFVGVSGVLAVASMGLGWAYRPDKHRRLAIALAAAYLGLIALTVFIEHRLALRLDHGVGG